MESSEPVTEVEDKAMSRLEEVDGEFRSLTTKVIYEGFEGEVDPNDRRRLEELGEELMRLTDPQFLRDGALTAEALADA